MAAYSDGALCSLTKTDRRFRSAYCLQHQGDEVITEEASTSEMSVNLQQTTGRNNPEYRYRNLVLVSRRTVHLTEGGTCDATKR
jgi:hypothetical protein